MSSHTAIYVTSNSPRSRRAAIRIQATFRGYACRKFFQRSVNDEMLEELEETEEWERDELVHLEEQEVGALREWAQLLAQRQPTSPPSRSLTRPRHLSAASSPPTCQSHSTLSSPTPAEPLPDGPSLQAAVQTFCSSLDHMLRADFQVDVLRDFLPPSWRRRWWDIEEDSPDPADQLDAIEDCVTFMAAKVKEVVAGILKLEPVTATSPLRGQVDQFLGLEDRLEASASAIESELNQLVCRCQPHDLPSGTQQQLVEFQRHLQREKECSEEGSYLHGALELPTMAGVETKFQRQRRLRRSPNARPGSAGSTGSTDSAGESASDLLSRFQRWRTTCMERACDRWQVVLQRRETNLVQTMAIFTAIQQSLAGGRHIHVPVVGSPLLIPSIQPPATDARRAPKDGIGKGHKAFNGAEGLPTTGNGGAVPRTFTGSLGAFSPHVAIGWEEAPAPRPTGATLPQFADVVKPSRSHVSLMPLKAKAKLALDQKAIDAAELNLQDVSLTSADGLDMYRNAPMFMAAMPT